MLAAVALVGGLLVGQTAAAPRPGPEPLRPGEVDLATVPDDLTVPPVTDDAPAAGRHVRLRLGGRASGGLYHALYLPVDWRPDGSYPLLVEYPGNGPHVSRQGDVSTGRLEDCVLGYGLSGGRGMLWLSLPFVDPATDSHTLRWWGDPDATAAYCRQAVDEVCRDFGGDRDAVVLCGFSRGAIACGYIGLRDRQTASLWRALVCHSHYDGVRPWDYPASDFTSAVERLARLGDRPQFISHERTVEPVRNYLDAAGYDGPATLMPLPFPNHTAAWVLKDLPERRRLRAWLAEVLARKP